MRLARQYMWVSPGDCEPPHGLDMTPGGRDMKKVKWLEEMFRTSGFDPSKPALIGYPLDGRIQLLSGTHRHMAAGRIPGFKLPVTLFLSSDVRRHWGTDEWSRLIQDLEVSTLEEFPVPETRSMPDCDKMVTPGSFTSRPGE